MSEAPNLADIYARLEANPGDGATLCALADWFEANDQAKAAECVRWLAERGKVPFRYTREADIIHHFEGWNAGWWWWTTAATRKGWGYPKSCRLPRAMWGRMKHMFPYDPVAFKDYSTVREAIEAVIAAWTRRPPAARKKSV